VPRRGGGFSLLEVLVAFVILALVLGVVMRIYAQGMARVSESDSIARAVLLAESKLAQVGADIPLEEGELSGIENDEALRWRVRLVAYDPDKAAATAAGAVQTVMPVRLLQVEVEVSWGESQAAPRSLRLQTVKLAPRTAL
jgi:general secretion pathway protein I